MDVQLKVLAGSSAGTILRVVGPKFYVGRSTECHLRARSDAVSRLHCVLAIDEEQVILCDLHSRNGTYVNGERIAAETRLRSGDHIKIGPLEFEMIIKGDQSTIGRHAGRATMSTAKITSQETDPAEGAAAVPSDEADDAETKPDPESPAKPRSESVETDEAAAQALRWLRRYRRG
jgi:pSer/pThr/pTyr-binding forkhead associated (FHA) protein